MAQICHWGGEGDLIYKMIITLCQGCRRIYGDDCTINVMKIAPQQLHQVSVNIPDSIVHQGDHLPRNVVVRNAVAEIQHISRKLSITKKK